MSSVSDVQAQSSFGRVEQKFEDKGDPILDYLKQAAIEAIEKINTQLLLADSEFPTTAPEPPLTGSGGTNVLYDEVRAGIETGRYGIDPSDEERLFERMKEREERQVLSASAAVFSAFSAGGFTRPSGAYSAAIERIRAEGRDRVASGNREIAIAKHTSMIDTKLKFLDLASKIDQMTVDNVVKVLQAKLDQIKAQLQAQATLATAALSGMNVNLGLSVSGSAAVSGSESVSESYDKTAGVLRRSETKSTSESEEYVDYHTTNET